MAPAGHTYSFNSLDSLLCVRRRSTSTPFSRPQVRESKHLAYTTPAFLKS
jgi:hypothetical protein